MKHISLLVPEEAVLASIVDPRTMFTGANEFLGASARETGHKLLLDTAKNETEIIRIQLVSILFDLNKQRDVEFLIQNTQSVIIRLLDNLYAYQLDQSKNKKLLQLYTSISDLLNDILSYIENYLSKYLNIDEKIPNIYYSIINKEFQQQLSELNLQLKDPTVDHKLIEIISSTFLKTKSDKNKRFATYRNLSYSKKLLSELRSIIKDDKRKDLNVAIKNFLIYFNYNDPAFIVYMIDKLSGEVNDKESQWEKVLKLKYEQKIINQINCRPGLALNKDNISAKEQLVTWIQEEINFLQTKRGVFQLLFFN